MVKEGLEAIYRCIAKTPIKELKIISGKGTEVSIVRSEDEIKKSNQTLAKSLKERTSEAEITTSETSPEQVNRFDLVAPEVGFF